MKRIFAALLIVCMLLPLVACGTPASQPETPAAAEPQTQVETPAPAEPVGFTKEQYQQAAVEVAMAYYNKAPFCQYEARNLSCLGKWEGPMRNNHGAEPEYASADQDHFSQCTDFVMDVYISAFGYRMFNDIMQPSTDRDYPTLTENDPEVVFYWTPDSAMSLNDMSKTIVEMMEPGDMLATNGKDTGESVGSGHAMMCVGDVLGDGEKYMIHCWGKPLDTSTSPDCVRTDYFEPNGAIFLQKAKDLLLSPTKNYDGEPRWNLRAKTHVANYAMVIRPTEAKDFTNTITPAALSRMQYKGIEIDRRTVGLTKYNDLVTGQDLTFEVEITNNGKDAFTALPVSETLPDGVTLDAASVSDGGKVDGKTIAWTVDVPAGEAKVLTYTVKVDAPRGTLVTFPAGKVADIDSRVITMQVGGKHLTDEQNAAMKAYAAGEKTFAFQGKDSADLTFIEAFYKQVLGIELDLPDTIEDFLTMRFTRDVIKDEDTNMPKEDFAAQQPVFSAMEMYQHLGGLYVNFKDEGLDNSRRLLDLKEVFYQPGDIAITLYGTNHFHSNNPKYLGAYLYLGDGMVLTLGEDGKAVLDTYGNTMNCFLKDNVFDVLRPTLAFDDINAK